VEEHQSRTQSCFGGDKANGQLLKSLPRGYPKRRLDRSYRIGFSSSSTGDAGTCQRLPSTYMGTNLYVELGLAFSPTTMQQAIKLFGSDRVLFGTDYPAGPLEEQLAIVKQLNLNQIELEQILWKNSRTLFYLPKFRPN
jgi:hypothetical protein